MTATRERIERIQAEIKSLQPFFRQHAGGVCGGCDTPSEELLLDEYNDPMCFRCLGDTHEKAQKRIAQLAIDLSAALTALCEEMEREKWLPIKSAPRDGTRVDLWLGGGRITDCYWGRPEHTCGEAGEYCDSCPTYDGWVDETFGYYLSGPDSVYHDKPTHWTPLPQPPAT